MLIIRGLCASCFLVLCAFNPLFAQSEQPVIGGQKVSQAGATVTAAATADRVRFTAPSNVVRMQLQVISESGQVVFDVSSKGNVLDWSLQDSSGQRLQGSFMTVVTVKSLSGRVSEKIGSVSVMQKQVELKAAEASGLMTAQMQTVGPIEENSGLTILQPGEADAVTTVAHDGTQGEINRSSGALSFRLGDFFSGKDEEQMRLTEEGNLGIGTDKPQAKLDVAGVIRTRDGIEFGSGEKTTKLTTTANGSLQQTLADGTVVPNATGTGTQNKIAKWTDNAGTLGDALITESAGAVVIGDLAQTGNLQIFGPATADVFAGMGPDVNVGPAFNYGYAGASFGRSAGFFNVRPDASATPPNPSLRFMTANVQRMIVTNTGDVGIGTGAPGAKLDVAGNINTSTQYNIGGNRVLSNGGSNNLFAGVGAGTVTTGNNNAFMGQSAGNNNTTGFNNSFFGRNAGSSNTTEFNNTFLGSGSNGVFGSGITNATAVGAFSTVDQSNSLVLGSINGFNSSTADTNVGIGTVRPANRLHVNGLGSDEAGRTDVRITGGGSAGSGISLESIAAGGRTYSLLSTAVNAGGGGNGAGRLAVLDVTTGVYRMVIDGDGNVGVGTFNPKSKFQVVGLPIFINNAGALNAGLTAGAFYRTGGDPDLVCVVH